VHDTFLENFMGSFLSQLYSSENDKISFKYYAVPTLQCRTPELFEGLGPVTSHVLPHYVILQGAEAQKVDWDYRNDDLFARILQNCAGFDVDDVAASLIYIRGLESRWLKSIDSYNHRSARRWLDPQSTLMDDQQPRIGQHRPCSDSTCGWWSEAQSNASSTLHQDGEVGQEERLRPNLPGLNDSNRHIRTQEWVRESQKLNLRKSYRVSFFFYFILSGSETSTIYRSCPLSREGTNQRITIFANICNCRHQHG
jgi:hypothetical protein